MTVAGGLVVVIAIGAVFVARGSNGGSGRHKAVRIDLAAVAKASAESVHIHLVGSGVEGETFVGDGLIDPRTSTIDVTALDTFNGHTSHQRILTLDHVSYFDPHSLIDVPDSGFREPTDAQLSAFMHGRHWVSDGPVRRRTSVTTDPVNEQTLGDVGALSLFGGNVAASLAQLAKAGVKVADLGRGTIDGASVEHWRVRYSDHDLFTHDTDPPADEQVTTLDLWVDSTNHERRAVVSRPAVHNADEDEPVYQMATTFTDYGVAVHVRAPAAHDVVSFTAFENWLRDHQTLLPGGPSAPGSLAG
ncbi:MAG TPA: hypothetical protein VGO03_07895 [Acidimicrobiia bacterium]